MSGEGDTVLILKDRVALRLVFCIVRVGQRLKWIQATFQNVLFSEVVYSER